MCNYGQNMQGRSKLLEERLFVDPHNRQEKHSIGIIALS